ncbi:hypothetical protein ORI89_09105 [Sphingobacterium sp. UT-1RO-CII-1]|uniref:hypothetical protein n=1 Tax=Sphingobacterium sp. UT-1RO-CII-1 TaxID=2995225 RepID=UPI00227A179F|nr:hypothetical protein [Sphingobacterium sp. UT-1RO-CII-1]MCY4779809.1 hypothetical protein [Sphingobacterium sp. UT-1RO-CII-1]
MNKSILTNIFRLFVFFMIFSVTTSCSSKNDPEPTEPEIEEPVTPDHTFNQLLTITNLHTPHEGEENTFTLFSLEQNTVIDKKNAKTRLWDISFDNMFSSFIDINNKKAGYGKDGLGGGGIILVKKKFEDVVDIPEDSEFRNGGEPYGPDASGDMAVSGYPDGWFRYDFSTHICYPIEDHTLVVRTARGNYAKLKIKSVYKDQTDPQDWSKDSQMTYYTIDYVLAKKGSKTFEIKAD